MRGGLGTLGTWEQRVDRAHSVRVQLHRGAVRRDGCSWGCGAVGPGWGTALWVAAVVLCDSTFYFSNTCSNKLNFPLLKIPNLCQKCELIMSVINVLC